MSIYIASHKTTPSPSSDLYKKIALGGNFVDKTDFTDDTGENISFLNRDYCELTATFWLWKNCMDEYIGLCHYRRYFNFIPLQSNNSLIEATFTDEVQTILEDQKQEQNLKKILNRYDLIIPRTLYEPISLEHSYKNSHRMDEWDIMIKNLDLLYGKNRHGLDVDNRFHLGNMIICKKNTFDLYASQLFFIINNVYRELGAADPIENARYQPYRYPGYLAERFTTAFINANRLSYYEAQVINISGI